MALNVEEIKKYLENQIQEMDLNYELGKLFGTATSDNMSFWSGRSAICNEILAGHTQTNYTSAAIVQAARYSDGDVELLVEILEIVKRLTPYHVGYFESTCTELYGEEVLNKVNQQLMEQSDDK